MEKAAERLKEVAEPAAYDARDYVNQSLAENSPLEVIDTETKNSLVEMYLGISVSFTLYYFVYIIIYFRSF